MSIFNAFVTPELAIIGFDTEGTLPDGSTIDGCKTIFLPHLSAAVGFRGLDLLLAYAAPSVINFPGSFDDLADRFPEAIAGAQRASRKQALAVGANPDEPFDFFLVGFSPMLGRMVGHAFTPSGVVRDFPQAYAPGFGLEDEIRKLRVRADRQGMIALALEQCRLVRERAPAGSPAGGRLFIAEIQRGAIMIEEVCHFPPREAK